MIFIPFLFKFMHNILSDLLTPSFFYKFLMISVATGELFLVINILSVFYITVYLQYLWINTVN